jgi:hypothetical protein
MAYPNITATQVRNGIKHVNTTLVTDARITNDLILEATRYVESKFAGKIDLTALKALATTPPLWQDMIIYKCRSLTLMDIYNSARTTDTTDIEGWNNMCDNLIKDIISNAQKLLDASGNIIAVGVAFFGIESNKKEADDQHKGYFGHGDQGEHKNDINDGTVYNDAGQK